MLVNPAKPKVCEEGMFPSRLTVEVDLGTIRAGAHKDGIARHVVALRHIRRVEIEGLTAGASDGDDRAGRGIDRARTGVIGIGFPTDKQPGVVESEIAGLIQRPDGCWLPLSLYDRLSKVVVTVTACANPAAMTAASNDGPRNAEPKTGVQGGCRGGDMTLAACHD